MMRNQPTLKSRHILANKSNIVYTGDGYFPKLGFLELIYVHNSFTPSISPIIIIVVSSTWT